MILILRKPIALRIPISFAYSKRLAVIDELREKKHKNIVIIITTSNNNDTI